MHIHWLQHVPFEGLGVIESWALTRGYRLTATRLWAGDRLPPSLSFDWLVVMGGPMGVHDEASVPWLVEEKRFIEAARSQGKIMLGICLGAQLIASACGAEVKANGAKEIGWYPLVRDPDIPAELAAVLPERLVAFHWHGDTFSLPPGSKRLYSSDACLNQGFVSGRRIIGLQFHPEITMAGVAELIGQCRQELREETWIQTEHQMLTPRVEIGPAHELMYGVLAYLEARADLPGAA